MERAQTALSPGKLARPGRPLVMGIVNATPDSFYAGSRAGTIEEGLRRCRELVDEGAELLDIGGESTRPGSEGVSEAEELSRVVELTRAAARLGVPVSIDTSKAAVARAAREAGARILNDVAALRADRAMAEQACEFEAVVLMHMQGEPRTMQEDPRYGDVVQDLLRFFEERLAAFVKAGGEEARAWIDPGLGFGKTLEHNLEILRRLEEFKSLGRPVLLGASRKSFIGRLLAAPGAAPRPPEERLEGSLAVACRAAEAGVDVLRVHDAEATRRALDIFSAVRK